MTAGPPASAMAAASGDGDRLSRMLRPRIILSVLLLVMIVAVLLTPESSNGSLDLRLSTYSTDPAGAKGLYEVMSRLGWPTRRRLMPFREPLDTDAVYAVLGGPYPMTSAESHALLAAVRAGAGLVYVVDNRAVLTDSLPLRHSSAGGPLRKPRPADTSGCRRQSLPITLLWLGADVHLYYLVDSLAKDSLPRVPLPSDTTVFLSVDRPRPGVELAPAIVGYPLGRGRVVLVSDPDALRNDVIRVCRWTVGPRVVDAIAYASAGRHRPLVFDEYHEGYGEHASVWDVTTAFLLSHPVGHVILQLVAGSLVLLLALGVRALAPRAVARIERRSALEHVDALAQAYSRIGATRTATARLVRGLRRRHDHGGWSLRAVGPGAGAEPADDRFLAAVAASHPELSADVKRIMASEQETIEPRTLLEVATAVERVERAFTAPRTKPPTHHTPN